MPDGNGVSIDAGARAAAERKPQAPRAEAPATGVAGRDAVNQTVAEGSTPSGTLREMATGGAQRRLLELTATPHPTPPEGAKAAGNLPPVEDAYETRTEDSQTRREPTVGRVRILSPEESARLASDPNHVILNEDGSTYVADPDAENKQNQNQAGEPGSPGHAEPNIDTSTILSDVKVSLKKELQQAPTEEPAVKAETPTGEEVPKSATDKVIEEITNLQNEINAKIEAGQSDETAANDVVQDKLKELEKMSTGDLVELAVKSRTPLEKVAAAILARNRDDFKQVLIEEKTNEQLAALVLATSFDSEENMKARQLLQQRATQPQILALVGGPNATDVANSEYANLTTQAQAEEEMAKVEQEADSEEKTRKLGVLGALLLGLAIAGGAIYVTTASVRKVTGAAAG